jgi:hypothetical protein
MVKGIALVDRNAQDKPLTPVVINKCQLFRRASHPAVAAGPNCQRSNPSPKRKTVRNFKERPHE